MKVAVCSPSFADTRGELGLIARRLSSAVSLVAETHAFLPLGSQRPSLGFRSVREIGADFADSNRSSGVMSLRQTLLSEPFDCLILVGWRWLPFLFTRHELPVPRVHFVPAGRRGTASRTNFSPILGPNDRIVALSEAAGATLIKQLGEAAAGKVVSVGFALKVHELVTRKSAFQSHVLVPAYLREAEPIRRTVRLLALALEELPELDVVLVAERSDPHERAPWVSWKVAVTRADQWWWMAQATALVEGEVDLALSRDVIESMLLGTPPIVSASATSAAGYVSASAGGFVYRNLAELQSGLRDLQEPLMNAELGSRARAWAETTFGDTDLFVSRVAEALLP